MRRLEAVLIASVTVAIGGLLAASCVTESAALTPAPAAVAQSSVAGKGPRAVPPPIQEPNHAALAMKHVTAKNYQRQLARLDGEIAAAEGLLNRLDEVPVEPQGSRSSTEAAAKKAKQSRP
ncbi:hypothetical protein KRR26_03235 [Corallococcus sp. M34]|uniref:hypothetical protein n=1 Tax=Citreicoccus inhibens TaxID=2849499 RepID=UPI0011C49000|nr:hypothetical protein [Citreicoccus inhibens]MBU8894599.1 hypothetical protein [Citreicoccus inhibens]